MLYGLVFLSTFVHAILTQNALTCCPSAYADIFTFIQCAQAAAAWTLAVIAFVDMTTAMVFPVPNIYYRIKEKCKAEGVDATLEAMREAGGDDETRSRVEIRHREARQAQRAVASGQAG